MSHADHTTSAPVEYRPIPGFPAYRAGDDGSIWSLYRRHRASWEIGTEWKRLIPVLNGDCILHGIHRRGRYKVTLCRDGRKYLRSIHTLILEAFVGPCPQGMEACHNDDDRANNRLDNLRWDTHRKNVEDKIRNGRTARGERNGDSRLKESDIPEVFRLYRSGMTQRQIGELLGVSKTAIGFILRRKNWRHVPI